MASRTAYVGTQNPGDILTSANFTKLPGGWIGDASAGATDTTGVTTETAITNATVTVTVGSNRRLKITGTAFVNRTVADGHIVGYIKESSTKLGRFCQIFPSSTSAFELQTGFCTVTPTSGSHTYYLSLERNTGTGTVGHFSGGGVSPAQILVEDIGPAS